MKKIEKLRKILSILLVVGVLGGLTLYTHTVRSSALQNMSGYAWGGDWTDQNNNGIQDLNPNNVPYEPTGGAGWISFNCTSGGNCGSNDYGVNIEANGDLVGYAWSSNYGWLKFGGLSGFPTGPGVSTGNARLNGNQLEGWARFCAGASDQNIDSPNYCIGTVPNPLNGGWDGWVSLKGPGYGVTLEPSTGILSGFAWGGNDNGKNIVGWVNFNTDFGEVIYEPVTEPTVSLVVESDSIPTGGTVELSWSGANLIESDVGCQASGGAPGDGWPGQHVSPEGTFTTNPINTNGTYTYSISCYGNNDSWSELSSVTVTVGVILDFYAEPSPVYSNNGFETVLHWTVSPSDGDLHNCQATSTTSGEDEWNGADIDDPTPSASFGPVYVPQSPTNFTITCQNAIEQNVVKSVLVYRSDLPENVEFDWDTVTCNSGLCTTTLIWELTNAYSCTASTVNPSSGTGWGGNIPVLPNADSQPGVIVPAIDPEVTTYILSCNMESGANITKELYLNNETGASVPPGYQEN